VQHERRRLLKGPEKTAIQFIVKSGGGPTFPAKIAPRFDPDTASAKLSRIPRIPVCVMEDKRIVRDYWRWQSTNPDGHADPKT
jgi:hypothetical protein